MTPPRVIVAQMYAGVNVGVGGTRTWAVTAPTQAGETVLAIVGANNASIAVSGMTDTKGNSWTYDREFTTGPYTDLFRLDGATGGPGGGPSAALAPGDGLVMTSQGNVSAQMGMLAVADMLGPLGAPHTWIVGAAVTVASGTLTPPAGGEVIALALNQSGGGEQPTFDPPLVQVHRGTYGHVYLGGYLADAPPGPLTITHRMQAVANSRTAAYAFLPVSRRLPLRRWSGTSWERVGADA